VKRFAKNIFSLLIVLVFLFSGMGEINLRGVMGVSTASAQEVKKKRRQFGATIK